MAKAVYVVFDTDLEKVAGVYDNPEAADECENASPSDRYTIQMDLMKVYNEEDDIRYVADDIDDLDDARVRISRDDEDEEEGFILPEDEDERDPYGD